jgi:hypothetical protein
MNDHEAGFLAFIEEPQRRRVQTLFQLGEKRRRDIVSLLHHNIRLDRRYCRPIPGEQLSVGPVERRLVQLGAPAICFVIGGGDLDGGEFILKSALLTLIGFSDGAFVSCIPGKLGYYQYEGPNDGHLCHRQDRR